MEEISKFVQSENYAELDSGKMRSASYYELRPGDFSLLLE
jgi:hypothetical protein